MNRTHAASSRAGFTLAEVLIAVTIVVILGAVVGLNVLDLPQKGRVGAARQQLETFKTAIAMYAADNGDVPTAEQGLEALVAAPTRPPVAAPADDPVPPDDHAAHGHFSRSRGLVRQGQGMAHPALVVHQAGPMGWGGWSGMTLRPKCFSSTSGNSSQGTSRRRTPSGVVRVRFRLNMLARPSSVNLLSMSIFRKPDQGLKLT